MPVIESLVGVKEVAKLIGLSARSIWKFISEGRLLKGAGKIYGWVLKGVRKEWHCRGFLSVCIGGRIASGADRWRFDAWAFISGLEWGTQRCQEDLWLTACLARQGKAARLAGLDDAEARLRRGTDAAE